jgi:hypothetical protein
MFCRRSYVISQEGKPNASPLIREYLLESGDLVVCDDLAYSTHPLAILRKKLAKDNCESTASCPIPPAPYRIRVISS